MKNLKIFGLLGGLALVALSGCEKPACDATTCSTGCCDADGECRPGSEVDACGVGGRVCISCAGSQTCGLGVCSSSNTGGGTGTGGGSGSTGGGSGMDYVVTLNEVATSDGDFFELINTGTTTADLSGFKVADLDGAINGPKLEDALTLPAGTTLAPGAILLFTEGTTAGPSTSCGSTQVTSCFTVTFGLSAGNGDSIFLVDASGATVMRVDAPADAHPPNASYGRLPDGTGSFLVTSRTPGLPNAAFMPVDAGTTTDAGMVTTDAGTVLPDGGAASVVFNEVAVSNGDFFELLNVSGASFDLSGYKLADLDSATGGPKLAEAVTVPAGTTLAPGAFLLFNEGTTCGDAGVGCLNIPYGLSGSGEALFLLTPGDVVEQRLDIPASPHAAGRSFGRIPDGAGSFVQTLRTPGRANELEVIVTPDAGTSTDAGTPTDAGIELDAGVGFDGGIQGLAFNEVAVSNGDFFELFNVSVAAIDLSGFKVADLDGTTNGPKIADAVTLPAGTVIAGGGRQLFYEGTTCGAFTGTCINFGFGLSGNGESLFLLSPANDVLLRLDVPASSHAANRSFGRIPDGAGVFVETARTPGEVNALFSSPDAGVPMDAGVTIDAGVDLQFVVVSVGPGQTADGGLNNAATPVTLEYRSFSTGALQRSIALPTAVNGANRAFSVSGSATSEGVLSRSAGGWTLGGYDAPPGTPSVVADAGISRVVAWVSDDGGVNTSTTFNDAYVANNIRSAASVDGTGFWTGGPGNGVRYAALGSPTTVDVFGGVANVRAVKVFQGQLYASTAAATSAVTARLFSVGTGLPQATTTATGLPGTFTLEGPVDFVFLDLATPVGPDRLYVADSASNPGPAGSVRSFTFDGTSWASARTFTPPAPFACTSVAAKSTAAGVVVLCSAGGAVYRWLDDGVTPPVAQLVVAVTPGFVFRGVGFE